MNYAIRIQWIRERLLTETAKQLEEKAKLRHPHSSVDNVEGIQSRVASRAYVITALLIMLNRERNKLRPADKQKMQSHWSNSRVRNEINGLTNSLDRAHPYPILYVVVDSKLTPIQKGIQAAHAVAELFKQHGVLDHSALVFLESPNVLFKMRSLTQEGLRVAAFYEPAWNGRLTAVAVEPLERDRAPDWFRLLELAA